MEIGFVGLGSMGGAIARRLAQTHRLVVYDLRAEAVEALASNTVTDAASPRAVGERCSFVGLCLPTSEHVRAAIFGDGGLAEGMAPGGMIADMTSGDAGATKAMAAELAARGIALVDAPVSGGPKGALAGTLAVIVGGSADEFARAKAVFDAIGPNVVHAGAVGAGHALKAANNLLNMACRAATFEVLSLLAKAGLDPKVACAIIDKSSGRNYATEVTLPDNILSGKMHQGFTLGLMHKDCGLAVKLAQELNVPMALGNLARDTLTAAVNEYGPADDMSVLAHIYERATGARLRPEDAPRRRPLAASSE